MNQPSQDSETQTPETPTPPPLQPPVPPSHPRFAKPQRVAFVQSAWHRDVVEQCRIAFLAEAEARHITNIDVF